MSFTRVYKSMMAMKAASEAGHVFVDEAKDIETAVVLGGSTPSFNDMQFHDFEGSGQMIVATAFGAEPPRLTVTLRRDGQNGLGEDMGEVVVNRYNELITGTDSEAEMDRKIKMPEVVVMTYRNELDKAQGYAQGVLDGIQIGLGLAGTPS